VNPGVDSTSEFSLFWADPTRLEPAALQNRLPTLSSAGILIQFPATKILGYVDLICTELLFKKRFLSARQKVRYLRLVGFPFRQLDGDQLTQLLFRLCSSYSVLEGRQGERSITLEPQQCLPDNLALLKGLGFNNIRMALDAATADTNQGLASIHKAVTNIDSYSVFNISATVYCCATTQPDFIYALVSLLAQAGAMEIAFSWRSPGAKQQRAWESMVKATHDLMQTLSYQLFGDHCFKSLSHPDIALLKNNRLAYGPWGFHNSNSPEWLALGVAAEGMIGGYLYQNTADSSDYRKLIHTGLSPVRAWSWHPMADETVFDFIQQLYCHAQVEKRFFSANTALSTLFNNLKTLNWVEEQGSRCRLTPEGSRNISTLYRLYNRALQNRSQQLP